MYNTDSKMEMLGKDDYLLKYIQSRGQMFIQHIDNKTRNIFYGGCLSSSLCAFGHLGICTRHYFIRRPKP